MSYPDYIPKAIISYYEELSKHDAHYSYCKKIKKLFDSEEMEDVFVRLRNEFPNDEIKTKLFIISACAANVDMKRYYADQEKAKNLLPKISQKAQELKTLLDELNGLSCPISHEFSVLPALIEKTNNSELNYANNGMWKHYMKYILGKFKAGSSLIRYAWSLSPSVSDLISTIKYISDAEKIRPTDDATGAGISSRKKNCYKTQYLRAFCYLLESEHHFILNSNIYNAITSTANILLREENIDIKEKPDPDIDVTYDDTRKAHQSLAIYKARMELEDSSP